MTAEFEVVMLSGRKRGPQQTARFPLWHFCFPFWEVGKVNYWLLRLMSVAHGRAMERLDAFRGLLTLSPTSRRGWMLPSFFSFCRIPPIHGRTSIVPAELTDIASVPYAAVREPPSRAVFVSEWRRRFGPGLKKSPLTRELGPLTKASQNRSGLAAWGWHLKQCF